MSTDDPIPDGLRYFDRDGVEWMPVREVRQLTTELVRTIERLTRQRDALVDDRIRLEGERDEARAEVKRLDELLAYATDTVRNGKDQSDE